MTKKHREILVIVAALVIVGWVIANLPNEHDGRAESPRSNPVDQSALDAPGLLIVAHGAPNPEWNSPVLSLEGQVIRALGEDNPFRKVRVCMMEFASPTVADGIREMEEAGCTRIVVVPLLIAPSSHSFWDIPTLLGLYSDEELETELRREGASIVRSRLPITLTPTLDKGDLIPEIMVDRVKTLSKDPGNEAVVILAHGDTSTKSLWCKLMKKTVTYVCGETGITYGDWAFVHVGQSYKRALGAIVEAAKHRKRVILVGCYLSIGVAEMHRRFMKTFPEKTVPGTENPLEDLDIIAAEQGLLPDPRIPEWIADTAKKAVLRRGTD
ncbi:MAG: hypothetical protein DRH50_14550 [Deltaproteobacteria bacterium]|nr:MAG: hypothetical protein DRH50_14550 [Deltaproteobacteria bacterium]